MAFAVDDDDDDDDAAVEYDAIIAAGCLAKRSLKRNSISDIVDVSRRMTLAAEKQKQLAALLAKSAKFIVANLNAIEKEVYLFAIKQKKEQCLRACKTLKTVADVLQLYPEPDVPYVPRQFPDSFKQKVNDEALLKLVSQMDAVLALVRAKIIPLVMDIKTGKPSPQVSADIITINDVLKTYIAGLVKEGGEPAK